MIQCLLIDKVHPHVLGLVHHPNSGLGISGSKTENADDLTMVMRITQPLVDSYQIHPRIHTEKPLQWNGLSVDTPQ